MAVNLPPGEQQILEDCGLSLDHREVCLDEIDWDKSKRNHARGEIAIDETHIVDLTAAATTGAVFPDLVLARESPFEKQFVIWSGNHRARVYRETGRKKFFAVIVTTKDESLWEMIPRQLNVPASLKLPRETRIMHAKYAVKTWNWTAEKAAAAFAMSKDVLEKSMRADNVRQELVRLRVPTGSITETNLIALASIKNDNVLEEIGNTIVDAKLSSDMLKNLVATVKKERTEADQIKQAKLMRADLVGTSHEPKAGIRRSPLVGFKIVLTNLERQLGEVSSVKQFGVTDRDEIRELNERCEAIADELRRVAAGKARRAKASR